VDCAHDQLADGRRIWILTIAGHHSRLCVGQRVQLCIAGARLARWLDESGESRGLPRTLVLDNGPKMTSKALFFWSHRSAVTLHFI
jgi:putative transposase